MDSCGLREESVSRDWPAGLSGVRLKDVLDKSGVGEGARQVSFDGLDKPLLPATPDFVKALEIDQALDGEVMLAFELKVKATNRLGQSQPMEPLLNPAGYMRNVVESVRIHVT